MSRHYEPKIEKSSDLAKQDEDDVLLDRKLRQLADGFLDESIPDSLLDVLRRGFKTQSIDQDDTEPARIDPDRGRT